MLGWALSLWLATAPGSWLRLERCPDLDPQALQELTEIERSAPIGSSRATVRCEPEAFVVRVYAADGREQSRRVRRTKAVGDVPERYLAVEIAELMETSGELVVPGPPSPPPSAEPSPAPREPREPSFRRSGWVTAGARLEGGGRPGVLLAGGSVRVGGRIWKPLSLRAELLGLGGGRRIGADGLRLGVLGATGAALATFDAGPAVLQVGAGARLGGVWLRGISGREGVLGQQHRGATWSPLISLGGLGPLGRRAVIAAHLDGGWTLRPVRGLSGSRVVFSSGGPWVGVSLAGGFLLGG